MRIPTILLLALSACSPTFADAPNITGTWECKLLAKTDNGTSDNTWTVTYMDDGSYASNSSTYVSVPSNAGEFEIRGESKGTYMIFDDILRSQSQSRISNIKPLAGPIINDARLKRNIEAYFRARDDKWMSNPFEQKIHSLDQTQMRLVPLTEPTKEMVLCARMGGSV